MRRLRPLLLLALLAVAAASLRAMERTDIAALHPDLRDPIQAVIARLESEGHTVRISATWRSPVRQEIIFHLSQLSQRLGRGPGTTLRGGRSCHNQRLDGEPAAAAADLRGSRLLTISQQADFYKALGRAAKAKGLRWGGDWKHKNPIWAAHGLGWDPGHIEHRALCQQLRR
jgi:hypothetical protein